MIGSAKLNYNEVTILKHVCFFFLSEYDKGQPDQSDCEPGPPAGLQTNMSSAHTADGWFRFRERAKEEAAVGLVWRFSNESVQCGKCDNKTL